MQVRLSRIFLACASLAVVYPSVAVLADGELQNQLKGEVPSVQREYRKSLLNGLSFRVRRETNRRSSDLNIPKESRSSHVHVLQFPWLINEEMSGEWMSPSGESVIAKRVRGINGDYAFRLSRPAETSPWVVTSISTSDRDESFYFQGGYEGKRTLLPEELALLVIPVLDVEGVPVERLVNDPSTDIKSAVRASDGRVRIEFNAEVASPLVPAIGR